MGRRVAEARRDGKGVVLDLDDGGRIATDVVVVGAGRAPRIDGIGLDSVGVTARDGKLAVDERCRLVDGLWAVGDVTGLMLFTHLAKYQARVAASNILGHPSRADYRSIPRVVFSDPEIAAAGLSEERALRAGIETATSTIDLPDTIARPWTYERGPRGRVGLVADRRRRVLVGAWAVAPLAGEWIHSAVLAIRAEIPIETLLDTVAQFPTYSEAYLSALTELAL